jgi:hypothetical protein
METKDFRDPSSTPSIIKLFRMEDAECSLRSFTCPRTWVRITLSLVTRAGWLEMGRVLVVQAILYDLRHQTSALAVSRCSCCFIPPNRKLNVRDSIATVALRNDVKWRNYNLPSRGSACIPWDSMVCLKEFVQKEI